MGNIFDKPVIGVVMCRNRLKGHETQTLQEKYLNAVLNAGGLPIALPHALAEPELLNALLPKLDGIFLPGSPSNVQPHLYGENGDESDADPGRDLLSMALITAGLERRIPIFAICRGLQELVVATGGTLYRRLCDHSQFLEHREDAELPVSLFSCHRTAYTANPVKSHFVKRVHGYFLCLDILPDLLVTPVNNGIAYVFAP